VRLTVEVLECLGLMAGGPAVAFGWMFLGVVWLPALADALRLTARLIRVLFAAIGWAGAIARLFL
jgi:hypothetical protein